MKKPLFVALLLLCAVTSHMAYAQNLQLHYKTAKWLYPKEWANDAMLMSTVEMFKADPWGDTFFFVDMTYTKEGLNYAYWEIARNLKFWEAPFAVHLEYNGGLQGPFLFNHAYLAGGTYAIHSKDFSKTFSVSLMYKYIQGIEKVSNYQVTAIWGINFAGGKCSFSGFIDWWRQENPAFQSRFVLLSQPQFWLNLNAFDGINDKFKLSVGTEVEFSNNLTKAGFYVVPTLALKWTFD